MEIRDAVVVVTGGASGIGRAMAARAAAEGARGVAIVDLDGAGAEAAADAISAAGGVAMGLPCDVTQAEEVDAVCTLVETALGPIDLFCANAGIGIGEGPDTPDDDWAAAWQVNTFSHVLAARRLLPGWLERGSGYFLSTASAAGLLSQIGSAPYAVTKHAAVAFAEWLSITYGDRGVGVSCLCPMGVNTPLLDAGDSALGGIASAAVRSSGAVLEPDDVAAFTFEAVREGRFLVLPHPEVHDFLRNKADDPDRWLAGMRRLQARLEG